MAGAHEILLLESSFSATPVDSSNVASISSTPPTTATPDNMSLTSESDTLKLDSGIAGSVLAQQLADSLASQTPEIHPSLMAHRPDATDELDARIPTPVSDAIAVAMPTPPGGSPSTTLALPPTSARPRRARASEPVYNLSKLLGTDQHGKRRANGDIISNKRSRASHGVLGSSVAHSSSTITAGNLIQASIDALDMNWSLTQTSSPKIARAIKKATSTPELAGEPVRRVTRATKEKPETLATKLSSLSKRGRKTFEKGVSRMTRELRRLQDTNEFAHIDERPVKYTVWSNGKYLDPDEVTEPTGAPSAKRVNASASAASLNKDVYEVQEDEPTAKPPAERPKRAKRYLEKGLYAGQETPTDPTKYLSAMERKALSANRDLVSNHPPNKVLPFPVFSGFREILAGSDFKLPRSVMAPLPPGQPKPPPYRTLTKNRFIGDAAATWKKSTYAQDSSTCICKPADGCGEDCQNRIMLYECDDRNCNISKELCGNRAFQDLAERTKRGGPYRIGVDVFRTGDRGFGVRSNRGFAPGQIIMEYTGEIITVDECERRMNEEYKDNECYYLMSFDQNMIIDATTGSAARFVNHSCAPNCRMIKWIVSGQPRMALFAGDAPIKPGSELTYDYNFDPFSLKSVQKCLCGSPNCRGVLGPKPKEVKKTEDKKTAKVTKPPLKQKRKLKEMLSDDADEPSDASKAKKRKTATGTALKRTISSASLKVAKGAAKGAATVIKRSVSSITIKSNKTKSSPASAKKSTVYKRRSSASIAKASKASPSTVKTTTSRRASFAVVASRITAKSTKKRASLGKGHPKATPASSPAHSTSSRKRTPSRKVLESTKSFNSAAASSPKSPKARSGMELLRKEQIRLVEDN